METITTLIILSFTCIVLLLPVLVVRIVHGGGKANNRGRAWWQPPPPPSPRWGWPVLGHIHLLGRCMDMRYVEQMKERLGGVYALKFGRVRNIFVVDADIVEEALMKKGAILSRRPEIRTLGLLNSNFRDINSSNDEYWRLTRRNLVNKALSGANVRMFAVLRRRSFHNLLPLLFLRHPNPNLVPFYETCRLAFYSITASFCFGFPLDHPEDHHLLGELITSIDSCLSLFRPLYLSHLYPFLRPILFPNLFRHASSAMQIRDRVLLSLIRRHRQASACTSIHPSFVPGSYVETLLPLTEFEDPNHSPLLSMTDVLALCSEFVEAGVTTSATTVEWAMAHLVKDPTLQEKLYRHILDVVGDRPLEEEDLPNLPYLRAVVLETLRLHSPAHFLIPHAASEPCVLGGYEIGTEDIISFCVASRSRDPEIWDEPMEFKPERMLSVDMDLIGTKRKMGMFPFGMGRRICPGMGLGQMLIEMFVGRLVQDFKWLTPSSPHNPHEVDVVSEGLVMTVRMANPLHARIITRHNNNNADSLSTT